MLAAAGLPISGNSVWALTAPVATVKLTAIAAGKSLARSRMNSLR
jgi:hypothetical protein